MDFNVEQAIEILRATPATISAMLSGLSDNWTASSGDADAWSAFDVVGHLIHADETNWMPRAEMILDRGENRTFQPFDRFAQFELSSGKTLSQLLDDFATRRQRSLDTLRSWNLMGEQLDLTATHPELGGVTLRQLLATWVVHDLNHVRQIVVAMAKKYETEVGPWRQYLSILK